MEKENTKGNDMIAVNSIRLDYDDLKLCWTWRGGPDCRLAEVFRRGGVFIGSVRPNNRAGVPCSDEEWYHAAWFSFAVAIGHAETVARRCNDKDAESLGRLGQFANNVCDTLEKV